MRTVLTAVIVLALHVASASAQIYRVAELNNEQIRALDRGRTVVMLPGGILEQHGPYLPSFADGYVSERVTRRSPRQSWRDPDGRCSSSR